MVSLVENLPINENVQIKLCRQNQQTVSQNKTDDDKMDSVSLHSADSICDLVDSLELSFPPVSEDGRNHE